LTVDLNRRLAALEARIRPAPGPEDDERAREELARRLDRLRERMIANGDLYEDDDGALCLADGTRLADLGELRTVGDVLQDHRARRLGAAMVRCMADE
jgi:hypothetical protein